MKRQPLPMDTRMRSSGFTPSQKSRLYQPVSKTPSPSKHPGLQLSHQTYQLSTLAGRADTVWHSSNLRRERSVPVSVWRSGFRDGSAHKALFNKPTGLAIDRRGHVYVADSLNHCIRRISRQGKVSTLAGNGERGHRDDSGRRARFNYPTGLAFNARQELLVIDQGNRTLRCLHPSGHVSTLALAGRPLGGLTVHGDQIYCIVEVSLKTEPVAVLARFDSQKQQTALLAEWEGRLQWVPYRQGEESLPFSRWWQSRSQRPEAVALSTPAAAEGLGLTADKQGNLYWLLQQELHCLEQEASQLRYHARSLQTPAWPARRWQGISISPEGSIYALDASHHQLYHLQPGGTLEAVLAGHPVFSRPHSVVQDSYGQIYISDTGHWRICRLIAPGQNRLLQLARLAFLPYLQPLPQIPVPNASPMKGIWHMVRKHLQRWQAASAPPDLPAPAPSLAAQHLLDVLQQGQRSQQLACVKEVADQLRQAQPPQYWPQLKPILSQMLSHRDTAVRTLLIRQICDLVHSEADALLWLELLEQHAESNRLLKKYLIEVLVYLGQRYELYGHTVPLLVNYIQAPEEDVVEYVFQHLLKMRQAGYESLIDPLLEDFSVNR